MNSRYQDSRDRDGAPGWIYGGLMDIKNGGIVSMREDFRMEGGGIEEVSVAVK